MLFEQALSVGQGKEGEVTQKKKPVEHNIFNGPFYNLVAMQGIEPRTLRI